MDYLKEFQAFAGRFSAAAEDKLAKVDGGTYNEFFRFYSQRWPSEVDNAAGDEQRQINILLEELQLALESPSLLSAPQGTVLHTGAVEAGVGPALSQLCIALEKCLFFGADDSTPDFWWVLRQACDDDDQALAAACDAPRGLGSGRREGDDTTFGGHSSPTTRSAPDDALAACERTPEALTSIVCRLTRVHTGHARCRAWARGLLGLDGTSVEGELRRAAEVAAKHGITRPVVADMIGGEDEQALSVTTSMGEATCEQTECAGAGLPNDGGTSSPTDDQLDVSESSPNDGGGGADESRIAPAARGVPPIDRHDRPSIQPPSGALPLWLRPGLQGASILDDVCRFIGEFSGRLEEKGLSIRPSLDHAWLGQENIAAVTTYTWPRFPRERLRCYVRGAGLSLANGTYSPVELDEGESGGSLMLVGPNGCQICRQVRAAVGYDAPVAKSALARDFGVAGDEIKQTVVGQASRVLEESRTAVTALEVVQAPTAQLWCLFVPSESALGKRNAYYSLGDGTLPPSRGWRAMDAVEMPAPVLGFATHSDGDLDGSGRGGENETPAIGEEETSEVVFNPAVPVAGSDVEPAGNAAAGLSGVGEMVSSTPAATETSVENEAGGGNLGGALSAGQSRRRRKRRRSPELTAVCAIEEGAAVVAAGDRHPNGFVEIDCLEAGSASGFCGDNGGVLGPQSNAPDDEPRQASDRFVDAGTCSTGKGLHVDGDEDIAAFKAEGWALPAPSGELLLRAERTRELLRRTREGRASTLATREEQLLRQLDVAQGEYQEVLRESMAATVERVLAARSGLREEAEAEAAKEAQLVSSSTNRTEKGRSDKEVPSLEELIAEKAEELRNRPHNPTEGAGSLSRTGQEEDDHKAPRGTDTPPIADAGWPWPMDWLSAPLAPPGSAEIQGLPAGIIFGGFTGGDADIEPDDGVRADTPPFSIKVAAVEVVDAEDPDAAHVEYVLRVLYHEVRGEHAKPPATSAVTAATKAARRDASFPPVPMDDPAATELLALATAARGLLQRTRIIRKRLNSLCALHPRMVGELLEGSRTGRVESVESLKFPDPYELGTLEESILRIHRDKLTPRFKANTPIRKLSSQVETYLSGLLHFFGVLQAAGDIDVRARMCRALNDALSTCDRFGRKRRRGEFVVGVRIADFAGGRLGSKGGDDARLKTQRRRCMGCRCTIAAEFLGMKKDYFPCRFSDALFCRSLCHREDRRVIPHRVVHHWDFTPHRVCKDSAAFLDATQFLPVFDLLPESRQLFVAQQPLRVVRSRRKQLHSLRRAVLFHAEGQCASGAQIFDTSMDGRTHLAVNPDLYSMDDLTGVKTGSLLDFLEEACEALIAHVMDECETCEARNARVCGVCSVGDPVFAFQIGTVARCPSCSTLFHAKCMRGSKHGKAAAGSSSKWWVDQHEADSIFVCPQCNAVAPMSDVTGE